ncbi:MAG TPA: bifunctional DNA-binding transcriptional regulator/O6-methylguanine-DNA methyltransferase Ada [Terriglobia bacterium]|nr:bifunctional DNA-binding transcriptional regulator/O6-methylguanine-DNA methyltransferase Ada [Terriglobia bacterium]
MRETAIIGGKTAADHSAWWRAVEERDHKFDGAFVYAVFSTGVYCRPSCPARRPTRDRVVFFRSSEIAQDSGFRPCRRCHPEANRRADLRAQRAEEVCRYIEAHVEEPVTLGQLAGKFGIDPSHLQRTFKLAVGISPREYADACRMSVVKMRLRDGQPVTEALYQAGFGSGSRLYERSSSHLGMTPATYRKGGKGMRISYAIVPTSLAWVLVGSTERGVCTVRLGDSKKALEAELKAEFPYAGFERSNPKLSQWVGEIVRRVQGKEASTEIPLDVQATAFKRRVWQALCEIPHGATRSYQDVARSVGKPRAYRAVANACASNPVAIVVPCHRVIRSDGSLGGYGGGIERKQELLRLESELAGRSTPKRLTHIRNTSLPGKAKARQ